MLYEEVTGSDASVGPHLSYLLTYLLATRETQFSYSVHISDILLAIPAF